MQPLYLQQNGAAPQQYPGSYHLQAKRATIILHQNLCRNLGICASKSDTATVNRQNFSGEKEISAGAVTLMQSELFFGFNLAESKADTLGIILENNLNERFVIGYSVPGKTVLY